MAEIFAVEMRGPNVGDGIKRITITIVDNEGRYQRYPKRPSYSLEELFFSESMDTLQLLSILDDMDLLHVTEDNRYLLPEKLPEEGPEIDSSDSLVLRSRTISCV